VQKSKVPVHSIPKTGVGVDVWSYLLPIIGERKFSLVSKTCKTDRILGVNVRMFGEIIHIPRVEY